MCEICRLFAYHFIVLCFTSCSNLTFYDMKVVDSTITVNHNGHENMGKTYPAKLSGGYGFIAFHSLDVSDSTIIADENTKNGIYSYRESAVYDSCYLFVEEGIYGYDYALEGGNSTIRGKTVGRAVAVGAEYNSEFDIHRSVNQEVGDAAGRRASDATIYGNSLRLAERRIAQAERSGYKFLGWFAHRYEIAACIFKYIRYT